ncbi:MAG: hypothetical protein RL538_184 [Candidatus Parcubacteria bacterium]|jgi:putative (di)nucleoside polyphosphate hydrolase
MPTRYFRAGIGTVIYNDAHELAFFKRAKHPADIWQFQQGGIDHGESPVTALWRELMEEVGLCEADIITAHEMPHLISYRDLNATDDHNIARIGQTHQWYFLKLKEGATIDLTRATDDEFKDWRWVTFEEAISKTSPHKQHVYQALHSYFTEHITKTPR